MIFTFGKSVFTIFWELSVEALSISIISKVNPEVFLYIDSKHFFRSIFVLKLTMQIERLIFIWLLLQKELDEQKQSVAKLREKLL